MAPKNILLVSEYFHPHWTGLAASFLMLARQLRSKGHRVTVITVQYRSDLPRRELLEDGIEIVRSPYLVQLSRAQISFLLLTDFLRLLRRNEVVVLNSPFSNILPCALLARLCGKRVLIYHQGDLVLSRRSSGALQCWLIERVFDICTWISCALSDRLVTYTEDYAQHSRVMRPFLSKCRAYIPPCPIPDVAGLETTGDFRARLADLKRGRVLIGFAGRFVDEKGFDILLRAIPEVRKAAPNAHFVFAGETNIAYERFFDLLKADYEAVSDSVTLLGLLSGPELACFYQSLDAFVLCSRSDCFALTQLEAALSGVPLIVSDIPGARVLSRSCGCGLIVETENSAALAAGIIEVVRDPSRYRNRQASILEFMSRYETFPLD